MKTSTKWMIGIAAALVLFFLLIFYSSEIYVWAMGKITTLGGLPDRPFRRSEQVGEGGREKTAFGRRR